MGFGGAISRALRGERAGGEFFFFFFLFSSSPESCGWALEVFISRAATERMNERTPNQRGLRVSLWFPFEADSKKQVPRQVAQPGGLDLDVNGSGRATKKTPRCEGNPLRRIRVLMEMAFGLTDFG